MGLDDLPDLGEIRAFELNGKPLWEYRDSYVEIAEIEIKDGFMEKVLGYVYGKVKDDGKEGVLVRYRFLRDQGYSWRDKEGPGFLRLSDIISYRTLK